MRRLTRCLGLIAWMIKRGHGSLHALRVILVPLIKDGVQYYSGELGERPVGNLLSRGEIHAEI